MPSKRILSLILASLLLPSVALAYGRTITNPATNSSLSSAVIRSELQTLENEITSLFTVSSTQFSTSTLGIFGGGFISQASSTLLSFNATNGTTTNATSTNLAVTTLCLTGDTCRTTWPTASASSTLLSDSNTFSGNNTFSGTTNLSGLTASRLVATDGSKNLTNTITLANVVSSISDVTGSTGTGKFVLNTSPTVSGATLTGTTLMSGTNANLRFVPDSSGISYIQAGTSSTDLGAELRIARYSTTNSNINLLRLDADTTYLAGNVGIGTTSPADQFGIQDLNTSFTFGAMSGASTYMGITPTGTQVSTSNYIFASNGTASGNLTLLNNPSGDVAIRTGNSNRLYVTNAGNVGIGTTSPYKTLSVGGDIVVGASSAGGTLGNLYLPGVASQSCLGTDSVGKVQAGTCSGSAFPFTPTTYSGVAVNSTSTPLWLTATNPFSLIASSTFASNASSTLATASSALYLPYLTSGTVPFISTNGLITSASNFTYSSSQGALTVGDAVAGSSIVLTNASGKTSTLVSGSSGTNKTITLPNVTGTLASGSQSSGFAYWKGDTSLGTIASSSIPLSWFSGGVTAYASSTIGDGTQGGGLTISGGATTTLNHYIGGQLAIATSSFANEPNAALYVQGASGFVPRTWASATNDRAIFDNNANFNWNFISADSGQIGLVFSGASTRANGLILYSNSTNKMTLRANGTASQLILDNAAHFGVQNTSPTYALDVTGLGHFSSLVDADHFVATSTSGISFFAGKIGIATTSPFAALSLDRIGLASSTIVVNEYRPATSTSALIDCRTSTQTKYRLGFSATTLTLTGLTPGQTCRVITENPNGTAGAITFAAASGYILLWAGGTAPTQTTTANKQDVYSFLATQGSSTITILGAQSANF